MQLAHALLEFGIEISGAGLGIGTAIEATQVLLGPGHAGAGIALAQRPADHRGNPPDGDEIPGPVATQRRARQLDRLAADVDMHLALAGALQQHVHGFFRGTKDEDQRAIEAQHLFQRGAPAQAEDARCNQRLAARRRTHRNLARADLPTRKQLRQGRQFGFRRCRQARFEAIDAGIRWRARRGGGGRGHGRLGWCRAQHEISRHQQHQGCQHPTRVTAHPVAGVTGQGLVGGAVNQAFADGLLFARITGHQGAVGDDVDQARNAAGTLEQRAHAKPRERHMLASGNRHAVLDVGLGLGGIQRGQVITRGDALGKLAQFRAIEHVAQLGLAKQDDLQQLLRRRFQVGQQADLLQRIQGQVLRLVDDQHHAQALRVGIQQIGVECIRQPLEAAMLAGDVELELLADGLDHLHGRELGIEQQGNLGVFRQLFEKQAAEGGLAGADFAGELHEATAAALADAIQQVRERIAVALGKEYIARVRRY